ncbi:MAG TPA: CRTAC1 family protein [Polyangiaceae bacterium]|nr:CRTAC1 family protein [Polyangiaceae bacterium]
MNKRGYRTAMLAIPRFIRIPAAVLAAVVPGTAFATPGIVSTGIVFHDIAANDGAGISYRRAPSAGQAAYDAQLLKPLYDLNTVLATPLKPHGQPGIALFDYDNDGDLDMYVTNGPGRANSLYQNKRKQTGQTTFVDVGVAAGVAATDMDSSGTCYGDIDNDGDEDLLVLGRMEPNRLFRNDGSGTFTEISATSNVGGGALYHSSCSMGDVNGDGKLDIFVANVADIMRKEPIVEDSFAYNQPNQLYLNAGGNTFTDVSVSSGIRLLGVIPAPDKNSTLSWAAAMVDYDLDGDLDIMHGDDQGGMAPSQFRGVDRGFIQIFKNDGAGNFTNVTFQSGTGFVSEEWMGLAFGDLNNDGSMDMFGTSVGDYMDVQLVGAPLPTEFEASMWHYGSPAGFFSRATFGDLKATPFGWGTGMADYDNDGFTDIIFYGGMDLGLFVDVDNPGTVLHNDGTGVMSWDQAATAPSFPIVSRSETQGVALGDLNDDGFVDITHVASEKAPDGIQPVRMLNPRGGPFDATANFIPITTPVGPDFESEWTGIKMEDGHLGVELSSANNGNKWVKVTPRGSVGQTGGARVPRDGIGAVMFFTPKNGKPVMSPVLGGSSHASEHELTQIFGLGKQSSGTLEVLWGGNVRNRLYEVRAGERLVMPEIPCSFSATWPSESAYKSCVNGALGNLEQAHVINVLQRLRLAASAFRAYGDAHH